MNTSRFVSILQRVHLV